MTLVRPGVGLDQGRAPKWLLALAGAGALYVAIAQTAAFGWTAGEMFLSWTFQGLPILLALIALALTRRAWPAAGVAFVSALLAAWPWCLAAMEPRAEQLGRPGLSILAANPYIGNGAYGTLARAFDASDAELIVMPEVPTMLPELMERRGEWKMIAAAIPDVKFNIAVFARARALVAGQLALVSSETIEIEDTDSLALDVRLTFEGRPLRLIALHPEAPLTPSMKRERDLLLAGVAARAARGKEPLIVAGDFNTTPGSPMWNVMLGTGVRRPAGPWVATWPSPIGALGVAIDHVLVGPELAASAPRPFDIPRSDHRGVIVDVGWIDGAGAGSL